MSILANGPPDQEWFECFMMSGSYWAVFLILVLSGLGLPIPEEVTYLVAGYVVKAKDLNLELMILLAMTGLLVGDTIIYFLGRRLGMALLGRWPFCKILKPKAIERAQRFFDKHGNKAVFISGFLAGVRVGTFFLAGTMRVPYYRFILLDFARSIITCPLSIYLGWRFGLEAEEILHAHKGWFFLGLGLFLTIVILIERGISLSQLAKRCKSRATPPTDPSGEKGGKE